VELLRTTSAAAIVGAEPTWRTLKVAVAEEELTVTRTVEEDVEAGAEDDAGDRRCRG
jgi:hypothetical protein